VGETIFLIIWYCSLESFVTAFEPAGQFSAQVYRSSQSARKLHPDSGTPAEGQTALRFLPG